MLREVIGAASHANRGHESMLALKLAGKGKVNGNLG